MGKLVLMPIQKAILERGLEFNEDTGKFRYETFLVMQGGNVHDHAFVKEAADVRFPDLENAYDYLRELSLSQMGLS